MDQVDRMQAAWARSDPALDASPLDVVGRIMLCGRHLERDFDAALEPLGLSFGDFDVINTLRRLGRPEGSKPTELARESLITTGAMTTRLHRLERAGLIARVPDPADGRGVLVRLTAEGERLARRALDAILAVDRAFLAPLDDRARARVAAGLRALLLAAEQQERP